MNATLVKPRETRVAIRDSRDDDVARIHAIYSHHVLTGLGSFEEVPPEPAEIGRRRAEVLARGLPHLVGEVDGRVAGYAYASSYRPRSGYRFSLEDSIYVDPAFQRCGIARRLLGEVIARCEAQGYRQMLAIIGDSANHPSIALHAALGFRQVGVLQAIGYKFGRWVDTLFMQRELCDGDRAAPQDP